MKIRGHHKPWTYIRNQKWRETMKAPSHLRVHHCDDWPSCILTETRVPSKPLHAHVLKHTCVTVRVLRYIISWICLSWLPLLTWRVGFQLHSKLNNVFTWKLILLPNPIIGIIEYTHTHTYTHVTCILYTTSGP